MAEKRFKSKVDLWIGLLVAAVILVDIVFIAKLAWATVELDVIGPILALIALSVLLIWLSLRTYYAVDKQTLRIVSGPFRWRIPLDEITSVTPSRSLWSSPALSLDRLRIEYGKGRRVLVSPAHKQEFLQAIGHSEGVKK